MNLFCFSRRFDTAGFSFSDHSLYPPLVSRNISEGTIGFEEKAGLRRHAGTHFYLEPLSSYGWLTFRLTKAVKMVFAALPGVHYKFLLLIFSLWERLLHVCFLFCFFWFVLFFFVFADFFYKVFKIPWSDVIYDLVTFSACFIWGVLIRSVSRFTYFVSFRKHYMSCDDNLFKFLISWLFFKLCAENQSQNEHSYYLHSSAQTCYLLGACLSLIMYTQVGSWKISGKSSGS